MADSNTDPVALAATRLEAAVERLAEVLARRNAEASQAALLATPLASLEATADMVPRAEVIALAEKLDETIARLRAAIGEASEDGEGPDIEAVLEGDEPDDILPDEEPPALAEEPAPEEEPPHPETPPGDTPPGETKER